ncbi:MAG: HIT domain-containing protein [Candidatus Saccharibacteria bacterium]|nr:HIT domain-containing protein [Candidatus Saccharibacteria bacterium]
MEESIFTKIIRGDIPSYKIYEDDLTYAFLDISPLSDGHTLVVPKVQVDKIYQLDDKTYQALFATAKKVAARIDEILGVRAGMVVEGLEVPHAHIHVVPMYDRNVLRLHHGYPVDTTEANMKDIAAKLQF